MVLYSLALLRLRASVIRHRCPSSDWIRNGGRLFPELKRPRPEILVILLCPAPRPPRLSQRPACVLVVVFFLTCAPRPIARYGAHVVVEKSASFALYPDSTAMFCRRLLRKNSPLVPVIRWRA